MARIPWLPSDRTVSMFISITTGSTLFSRSRRVDVRPTGP